MATDKEKEDAAKQRENIEVTTTKKEEPVVEKQEEEVEGEEKEVVEAKEEVQENKEEVEDLEDEKKDAKTEKDKERIQKRIDKLTAKNKELEKQLNAAQAALAAKPDDEKLYTKEEVERLARQEALNIHAENEFKASVARIASSCEKIDKDFSAKVNAMVEDISGANSFLPSVMVGVLDDMPDNGGPVLMHLAANPDEYEAVYQLSPARMALKLKDISDTLIAKEKKAKAKEISKVPEPKEKVAGKGTTPEQRASEKDDMDTFVRKRAREVEERQKARMH